MNTFYDIFISYNTGDQAVADEIYSRLTSEGFNCFLATEALKEVDWAGEIRQALENSRAFIIVLSQNASKSNEVMKEITLATRYSRFIFPFIIDNSKPDHMMEYHLAPFQWISATIPPMEMRYQDLIGRVRDALQGSMAEGNVNYDRVELVGQKLSPRAEFMGREDTLEELHEIFAQGDATVFLVGMGGIGKSEIARAYARKYRDDYDVIVMAAYQTDLKNLIADDRAIVLKGCSRGGVNAGQMETTDDYFVRKMNLLRNVVNSRTLLIIDNFDTVEDECLQDIIDLPCDKLFTTRTDFEEYGYPMIQVQTMDPEKVLLPLMEKLDHKYTKPADKEAVMSLIKLLECHTYAVSLMASQMRAGHIAPPKMLEKLRCEGLKYMNKSVISRSAGSKKVAATDCIRMLFDFSALTARDKQLMQYMACTPLEGIDIDLFMELAEIEDFEELRHLMALNWIQEDRDNNICRIHMLVRELTKEQLDVSIESCLIYVNNLDARLKDSGGWNNTHEENLLLEPLIMALAETFPEPDMIYRRQYDNFSTFMWVMNHFTEAEKIALYVYDKCVETFGPKSEEAGFSATRVAAVYHNQNDPVKARPWYLKAKEILLARGEDSAATILAIQKVARSDMMSGNYEEAEKGFLEAEAMAIRKIASGDLNYRIGTEGLNESDRAAVELCFVRANLAKLLGGKGHYEEAIRILKEQIEKLKKLHALSSSDLYFEMAIGNMYIQLKDYERGSAQLKSVLERSKNLHGYNADTLQVLEMLGDLYVNSSRPSEAAPYYAEAFHYLQKNFPGDAKGIQNLTEKYENSKNGVTFEIPYRYLAL